jgi:hypothetical protein
VLVRLAISRGHFTAAHASSIALEPTTPPSPLSETSGSAIAVYGRNEERVRPRSRGPSASIGTRDDLQQVSVRVLEIYATTVIPRVRLIAFSTEWIRPVGKVSGANATEDLVELDLTHEKRIMLMCDVSFGVQEI